MNPSISSIVTELGQLGPQIALSVIEMDMKETMQLQKRVFDITEKLLETVAPQPYDDTCLTPLSKETCLLAQQIPSEIFDSIAITALNVLTRDFRSCTTPEEQFHQRDAAVALANLLLLDTYSYFSKLSPEARKNFISFMDYKMTSERPDEDESYKQRTFRILTKRYRDIYHNADILFSNAVRTGYFVPAKQD